MNSNFMERRTSQKWLTPGGASIIDNRRVLDAAGPRRLAEVPAKAPLPGTGPAPRDVENQRLLRELQVLTDTNRELEAFSSAVSHDLCTPLTIVNGYCQILKEMCREQLDDASREYLDGIFEGTLRMKQLIASMLDFSRTTGMAPSRAAFDLSEVAQATAAELKLAAPERQVTFRIAEGIEGEGDAGLWRTVLDNLIGNAWKYAAGREHTVIEFGVRNRTGKPVCFVRDNGPGFDMALADQLFLPFRRGSGAGSEGHGIGLATVERIVRRHGGKVWAESKPNRGATFFFTMR